MPVLKSYDSRGTTRMSKDMSEKTEQEKTEQEKAQAGKSMAMPSDMKAFNAKVIADFRANHGQFTGPMAGRGVLILTTTGAQTGKARTAVPPYLPPPHPPVRTPLPN